MYKSLLTHVFTCVPHVDECSVVEPRVITQQPTVMCVDEAGSTPRKASSVYLQIESDEEEGDADVDATAATARGNMYVYDAGHTPKHLSPHHQTSDMEQKVPSLNNMELIQYDLPRTFPTLGFFHDGGMTVIHMYACILFDLFLLCMYIY